MAEGAVAELLLSEFGWGAVLLYIGYELRFGRLRELDKKVTSLSVVVRALARDTEKVDQETVDEHLAENGVEPEDFLVDEDSATDQDPDPVHRDDGHSPPGHA